MAELQFSNSSLITGTGSGLPTGGSPNTILIGSTTSGEGQWTSTMPQAVVIDDGVFN